MTILQAALPWLQIATAGLLIGAILFQRGSEEGLGSAFGGLEGGIFYTKRGLEKSLFIGTIILAILFFIFSLLALFI